MALPEHGLPWRVVGNKIVDAKGRTVLVVFTDNPPPTLQLVVDAVNKTTHSN